MKRQESELNYNETVIYRRCLKIHEAFCRMARDYRRENGAEEGAGNASLIIVVGEDGSVAFTAISGAGKTFASANIMQEVDDGKKEAL